MQFANPGYITLYLFAGALFFALAANAHIKFVADLHKGARRPYLIRYSFGLMAGWILAGILLASGVPGLKAVVGAVMLAFSAPLLAYLMEPSILGNPARQSEPAVRDKQ